MRLFLSILTIKEMLLLLESIEILKSSQRSLTVLTCFILIRADILAKLTGMRKYIITFAIWIHTA